MSCPDDVPGSRATQRIVSLLPSATEIVCLLGGQAQLVGVSHECDWPRGVQGLPRLTRSKTGPASNSVDIDREVRAILEQALAVYDLDVEALVQLAPDLIVTQDLCDVCAVSLAEVEGACAELLPEARIVSLHPTRWSEVMDDIRTVGKAMDVSAEAGRAVAAAEARKAEITARARAAGDRPCVLSVEWLDPVMVGGMWMPDLVRAAGGVALVTEPGQHAPTLTREMLRALDPAPEVVLIKPCGFDLERTLAERDVLARQLEGLPWPALANRAVWVTDGNAYFNRPGPRLVESIEILAACMHPGAFADQLERHRDVLVNLFDLD